MSEHYVTTRRYLIVDEQGGSWGVLELEEVGYPPRLIQRSLDEAVANLRGRGPFFAVPCVAQTARRASTFFIQEWTYEKSTPSQTGGVMRITIEHEDGGAKSIAWYVTGPEVDRLRTFSERYRKGFTAKDVGL